MRFIKALLIFILLAIVAFVAFAFILHNQDAISVNLLFLPPIEATLGAWLTVFFIAGGLLGFMACTALVIKEKAARQRLEKRLQTSTKIISGYSS